MIYRSTEQAMNSALESIIFLAFVDEMLAKVAALEENIKQTLK